MGELRVVRGLLRSADAAVCSGQSDAEPFHRDAELWAGAESLMNHAIKTLERLDEQGVIMKHTPAPSQ